MPMPNIMIAKIITPIIILAILVFGGLAFFLFQQNASKPTNTNIGNQNTPIANQNTAVINNNTPLVENQNASPNVNEVSQNANVAPLNANMALDTSNWKTYRNAEHGFEVKYPEGWIIEDGHDISSNQIYIVGIRPPGAQSFSDYGVFTYVYNNISESLQDWVNKNKIDTPYADITFENGVFTNYPAVFRTIIWRDEPGITIEKLRSKTAYVKKGDKIFSFETTWYESNQIIKQEMEAIFKSFIFEEFLIKGK